MVSVALLKPDRMSTLDLFQYIRHLDANGQTAQRYEIEFWRKVFYPLSCLVMVVLALPFAYLHFRQGGITSYVFGGVLIGISFFLLNNVFGYIGNLQNWSPWLTAAAPGLIYSLLSLARLRLAGAAAMSAMASRSAASSCSAHGSRDRALARSRWKPWRARIARAASRGVAGALRLPRTGARPTCRRRRPSWSRVARRSVRVVPMFLGIGKHVREDLPRLAGRSLRPRTRRRVSRCRPAVGEDAAR